MLDTARVYWEVAYDGGWREAEPDVQALGISRYRLTEPVGQWFFQYKLEFTNTSGWLFKFLDASGAYNDKLTVFNGDHSIEYNSPSPAIYVVQQGFS